MLSTIKDQLPSFQPPINKRLMIKNRLLASHAAKLQPTIQLIRLKTAFHFLNMMIIIITDNYQCPPSPGDILPFPSSPATPVLSNFDKEQIEVSNTTSCSCTMINESQDNCSASFQNVRLLLNIFSNQLNDLKQNPTKECSKPSLDKLYSHLLSGISILFSSSNQLNLASLAKSCHKRKLLESDKQLRLVANPKIKPGRKPLKKLSKSTSPEKKDLIKELFTPDPLQS